MNIGLFEQQMTRIIPSFAGFTEFTSSIPKLYWDVKSQEQRILAICKMLDKVICYADMLGENVDEIAHTMQEILDGKLDPMIVAAIEEWFAENEPQIMQDIDAINAKIGEGFDSENTVASAISNLQTEVENAQAIADVIGDGFSTENTVTDAFGNLANDFDGLSDDFETLSGNFDTLSGTVETIEDDVDDIDDRVSSLEQTNYSFQGWGGWEVLLNNNAFTAGRATTKSITTKSSYGSSPTNYNYSETMYVNAPMPFNNLNIVGSTDRDLQSIVSTDGENHVGLKFKIVTPWDYSTPLSTTVRLILTGIIREPRKNPTATYNAVIGQQIGNMAMTYYDAMLDGRQFSYGRNFFYMGDPDDIINDSNGRARMECDTYVGMVLRGIPYEISPYSVLTPDYTYEYDDLYTDVSGATNWTANTFYDVDDLVVIDDYYYWKCIQSHTSSSTFNSAYWSHVWVTNPYGIAWATSENADMHPANKYLGRDILFTGDIGFLGWLQDRVFSDSEQALTGDIAIWVRRANTPTNWGGTSQSPAFDNIAHVGIIWIENGQKYVLHVTGAEYYERTVINKTPIEEFVIDKPKYYYRPLYS